MKPESSKAAPFEKDIVNRGKYQYTTQTPLSNRLANYQIAEISLDLKEAGGIIASRKHFALIPFFCPNWLVRILKKLESLIEKTPIINTVRCAQFVFITKKMSSEKREN